MAANKKEVEKQIYDYVDNYIAKNKVNPSIRDITAAMGFKSTATAFRYVKSMEIEGKLYVNGHRGISTEKQRLDFLYVPIIGKSGEDYIPVLKSGLGNGKYFAFYADSSKVSEISDGELVIAKKQSTAENGDIVVMEKDGKIILGRYGDTVSDNVTIQGKAVKVIKNI